MDLVDLLDGAGVQFASGVPDSTLQEFCWATGNRPQRHGDMGFPVRC